MNAVSLIGTLSTPPDLQEPRSGPLRCTMQVAVPRCSRTGQREPGIVYIDVAISGLQAQECADRLRLGSRVGVAGRLDSADPVGVLIDQLDYL